MYNWILIIVFFLKKGTKFGKIIPVFKKLVNYYCLMNLNLKLFRTFVVNFHRIEICEKDNV